MRTVRLRRPSAMGFDNRLLNVLQLGFAFFIIFTAFQSCGQIQQTVLTNVHNRNNGTGPVDKEAGYYSLAIIYGVFTLFNFFAAALVGLISAKWAMVFGGCIYTLFLGSFLYITNAFLYSTSALLGIGAALIWVGQGQYLTKNSDDETMGRNSAIAWAMLQCSLPVGGIFLFTQFRNAEQLTDDTIRVIYIAFTCMAAAGVAVLALLRRPPVPTPTISPSPSSNVGASVDDPAAITIDSPRVHGTVVAGTPATNAREEEGELMKPDSRPDDGREGFVGSFVSTFQLLKTLPMLLLAVVFIFTGLELTFWSGVYGTSLANTQLFGGSSNELLAINSIFLGLGEIVAGGAFGILGKKIYTRVGRSPIVLLGMVVHLLSFVLIFVNIPAEAPIFGTKDKSYMEPNEYLAIFCSFLLGFADGCWNTQVYALLGTFYSENSAPAFALFKFFQSGAACGSFFYSAHVTLQWQLIVLAVTCVLGALAFFKVNFMAQRMANQNVKAR